MKAIRQLGLFVPMTLLACATGVTQDLSDADDDGSGASAGTDSVIPTGGKSTGTGGKSTAGSTSGTGPKAFGGTATSGGAGSGNAGEDSGGASGSATGGTASSGSGGSGGSGGAASGGSSSGSAGKAGAGGGGSGSGGSGGSPVGPGDCSETPLFSAGSGDKYAKDAKVTAVCSGGTPCTLSQPPLENGKSYEFSCLDQYNCGTQNPGTTNWSQPPWAVSKACE